MELETRKNLGGLSSSLRNFFVSANYTLVDSAVEISREQAPLLTNLNRALEGQSRHVFNGFLQHEHPTRGSMARLLYNYQGQRISDVGAQVLPDVVQVGVPRMDAVFIQFFLNKETGESRYLDVVGGRLQAASEGVVDFEGNPPGSANAYPIPTLAAPLNTLVGPSPSPVSTLDPGDLGVGRWAVVFDIRDVTGTRIFQRAYWHFVIFEQATELPAEINADMMLDWKTLWILPSRLHRVGDGATLTIEPGTVLLGTDIATLLIDRGGRIHAEGTALSPIIMTSDESAGSCRVQGWGGLVLAGRASINGCEGGNCEGDVEGVSDA